MDTPLDAAVPKAALTPPQGPAAPPAEAGGLRPFGYDIFRTAVGKFAPEAAVPVPGDYVLGPGDQLELQLYGNERQTVSLLVGRDGQVIKRYAPTDKPESLAADIAAALG